MDEIERESGALGRFLVEYHDEVMRGVTARQAEPQFYVYLYPKTPPLAPDPEHGETSMKIERVLLETRLGRRPGLFRVSPADQSSAQLIEERFGR